MLAGNAMRLGETYDEKAHINSGLLWLHEGNANLDPVNMCLRAVLAVPAYAGGMPVPAGTMLDPWPPGEQRVHLVAGRLVQALLYCLFAWGLGRWASRRLGAMGGLLALALMLYEPAFNAFGCLAGTDALLMYSTGTLTICAYEWLRRPGWRMALATGVAVGLCLTAKLSALPWGAGLALGMIAWTALGRPWLRIEPGRRLGAALRVAAQLFLIAAAGWLILCAAFRFDGVGAPMNTFEFNGETMRNLGARLGAFPSPVPLPYWMGIDQVNASVPYRVTYFAGQFRKGEGFFWYYPLLLLVKPTLAILALMAMAGFAALTIQRKSVDWADVVFFTVPSLFYLGATCLSPIQIGFRYLSPLFPLMCLAAAWGGCTVEKRWWRGAAAGLTASIVILSIHIAPHQLAWYNPIIGGPANAWKWYIDSNQDWGQSRHDIDEWIQNKDKPVTTDPVEGLTTGWVLLSPNALVGLTPDDYERFRWIRENFEPREFVMPHWQIYKIPEDHWTRQRDDQSTQ